MRSPEPNQSRHLTSYLDLVRFCCRLGILGWGFYNLLMFVLPFAFATLAITRSRRWVFVAGSICGIYQLLFEYVGPRNPEIQPLVTSLVVDHAGIVATLFGFWVKPAACPMAKEPGATGSRTRSPSP